MGHLGFEAKTKFPMNRFGWTFFLMRHITIEDISREKALITFLSNLYGQFNDVPNNEFSPLSKFIFLSVFWSYVVDLFPKV